MTRAIHVDAWKKHLDLAKQARKQALKHERDARFHAVEAYASGKAIRNKAAWARVRAGFVEGAIQCWWPGVTRRRDYDALVLDGLMIMSEPDCYYLPVDWEDGVG